MRSRKSAEFALVPNPLSGIAQKVPSRFSTNAENPGSTCPGKGPLTPLAGVMAAPDGGPGCKASASYVAWATSVGITLVRGPARSPAAAPASSEAVAGLTGTRMAAARPATTVVARAVLTLGRGGVICMVAAQRLRSRLATVLGDGSLSGR